MRVALLSDTHANRDALSAMLPLLKGADQALHLGDVVGYYCDVNDVIDVLRAADVVCIRGNHDQYLLEGCPADVNEAVRFGVEYADSVITISNRRWLAGLPTRVDLHFGGRRLLGVHGSPWSDLAEYVYPDSPRIRTLWNLGYDVIALGHTHHAMTLAASRQVVVNPGSVGQPRDIPASASAAIIDLATLDVQQVRVRFDPAGVLSRARDNGAGEWVYRHFQHRDRNG